MKIANPNPPQCSACYNQQPEEIHVDFDVAYDGPVLEGSIKVVIDDLYLCRNCLISAYKLLDEEGEQSRIAELEIYVQHLEERNRLMADRLNQTRELVTPV